MFPIGMVYLTGSAYAAFRAAHETPGTYLDRHLAGDWGELCAEDKQVNEHALQAGGRIFSTYRLTTGVKIYVITEADRTRTTVLLPSDY